MAKISIRNQDIVDNLAQINLLLTDKTGTLTQSKFEIVSLYSGGKIYGCQDKVNPDNNGLTRRVMSKISEDAKKNGKEIQEFLTCMALCQQSEV